MRSREERDVEERGGVSEKWRRGGESGRRERGGEGVVRVKWRWKREVEPSIIHVFYMHYMKVKSPVRSHTPNTKSPVSSHTKHTAHRSLPLCIHCHQPRIYKGVGICPCMDETTYS